MKLNSLWRSRLAQFLIGAAILIPLVVVVHGTNAQNGPVHMSTDWSHRHLIFSQPRSLMEGFKLSSNPRYVQQWIRRNAEKKVDADAWRRHHPDPTPLQGDWNVYLGNVGSVGAGNYPAKFYFDITAASCTNPQPDFVVYNTSLAGSATAVPAIDTGAFTARAGLGSTISITNGGLTLVMTAAGTSSNTGLGTGNFNRAGAAASLATRATDFANAINIAGNGSFVGVTATAAAGVVTITSTTGGTAGNSITVTSDPTSNFTWTFTNFVNGASGVPTIAAFDNLYSGCAGTVPSPYWAYNTGTGATAATSVLLSDDGQQVAFVQNVGAGGVGAQLVMLKWAAGTSSVNSPQDLTASPTTNVIPANYRMCTAPCMTTINFSGGVADIDANSSPFYDYTPGSDTLYVGDNNGRLHKFTGIFSGAPGETISAGADVWPAVVRNASSLTSPVYDSNIGKIFVADAARTLHSVDQTIGSGAGGIVTTAALGTIGITASPTEDASIGNVYVFVAGDTIGGGGKRAAVCRFATNFAAGATCTPTTGDQAIVATNNTAPVTALNSGDFDNIYYSSANGTGNLYVCGTSAVGGVTAPTIWQIPITAGAMGTPVQGPQLATANAECSPMTEALNGTTDRLFVSVAASGQTAAPIGCPANTGCIMSFDITSAAGWGIGKATAATAAVAGGASGIIIDSSTGPVGSSQIYFTPLATGSCTTATGQGIGGCAIQASQAAIQ